MGREYRGGFTVVCEAAGNEFMVSLLDRSKLAKKVCDGVWWRQTYPTQDEAELMARVAVECLDSNDAPYPDGEPGPFYVLQLVTVTADGEPLERQTTTKWTDAWADDDWFVPMMRDSVKLSPKMVNRQEMCIGAPMRSSHNAIRLALQAWYETEC